MLGSIEPNFLCIGAAKAGTTSIYSLLEQHHQVFITHPKEPCFFSFAHDIPGTLKQKYVPSNLVLNPASYFSLYNNSEAQIIRGDFSTAYLYYPDETIENIKRYCRNWRDIKIIIMLRNPIERAFSQWQMKKRDGVEPLDFQQAITEEERRIKLGFFCDFHYFNRGIYSRSIEKFTSTFPQTKIMLYDDLCNEPSLLVSEICEFLEIDQITTVMPTDNQSGVPVVKFLRSMQRSKWIGRSVVAKFIPRLVRKQIHRIIDRLNLRRLHMTHEDRDAIADKYRDEIWGLSKQLPQQLREKVLKWL